MGRVLCGSDRESHLFSGADPRIKPAFSFSSEARQTSHGVAAALASLHETDDVDEGDEGEGDNEYDEEAANAAAASKGIKKQSWGNVNVNPDVRVWEKFIRYV